MSVEDLSNHYVTGVGRLVWRLKSWRYRTRLIREAKRFPLIQPNLLAQLREVVPSRDGPFEYRPCRVRMVESGEWRDRVYVIEALSYAYKWGLDAGGREYLPLGNIAAIEESPTRLPPPVANKLYAAGESGMGYCVFTLATGNGQRIPCLAGNAIDWIQLPSDVSPREIKEAYPHERLRDWFDNPEETQRTFAGNEPYSWCLYRLPK